MILLYIKILSVAIHRFPIRQHPAITPCHCHRVLFRIITHASVINRLATPPLAKPSTAYLPTFTPTTLAPLEHASLAASLTFLSFK